MCRVAESPLGAVLVNELREGAVRSKEAAWELPLDAE